MGKNKSKWQAIHKGVRYKEHSTRKHGIRPDRYFSVRYQINGKSCESGLGWSSEQWTESKAIAKRHELIENAKAGEGVSTHKQTQKKIAKVKQEHEKKKKTGDEIKLKESMLVSDYFYQVYYPQIQKEKKIKTHQREESSDEICNAYRTHSI